MPTIHVLSPNRLLRAKHGIQGVSKTESCSLSLSACKTSNTHIYGSYSVNPTQNSTQKKSMKALHTFLQRVLINLAVSL